MAVSAAVRRYYAERIFARTTSAGPPPNFRPLAVPSTGRAIVAGCRGGGKNVLELRLVAHAEVVQDVRVACGLCNPAMLVAADIVADWARGRGLDELLAFDPEDRAVLEPLFARLGGPGRPDDAREKFQYTLLAVQNAVRDHRGEPLPPLRRIARPKDGDADETDGHVG